MNRLSGALELPSSMHLVKNSSKEKTIELILGAPMFQDMEAGDAAALARYLSFYEVDRGTVVFHEGEEGDFMGLIVDGIAELMKESPTDGPVRIGAEGAGKLVGEMALVDGEPRSATATFTNPGHVLILTKDNFQNLLREQPRAAANFLFRISRLLSQRLRRTTGLLSTYLK
jgi:CRP/FNR family transcriptional regulator, cyclic AMP receptor protein